MKQYNSGNIKLPQRTRHGYSRTPTYSSWKGMIQRCTNPSSPRYESYAGRGITVCDRWQGYSGFVHFLEDMGERPSIEYTLDRKDNDGNYEPSNCKWSTCYEQMRNRRIVGKRTGVHRIGKYWVAKMKYRGQIVLCEYCQTFDQAAAAREQSEIKYLGYSLG